jgi:hypothetical protein
VTKLANGKLYFPGTQQITDPSVAAVISANGSDTSSGDPNATGRAPGGTSLVVVQHTDRVDSTQILLNGNFTNQAITDAKGNLLLVNPAPG